MFQTAENCHNRDPNFTNVRFGISLEVQNSVALAALPLEVSGSCQMGQTANKGGVLFKIASHDMVQRVVRQSVNVFPCISTIR
jgi:hypothetical protein